MKEFIAFFIVVVPSYCFSPISYVLSCLDFRKSNWLGQREINIFYDLLKIKKREGVFTTVCWFGCVGWREFIHEG